MADGAVIWNSSSNVTSRAPRYSFGVIGGARFLPWSAEHLGRLTFTSPSGHQIVAGAWSQIVSKVRSIYFEYSYVPTALSQGISLDVEAVRRETFHRQYESATPNLAVFEVKLYSYSGDDHPSWARNKQGGMLFSYTIINLFLTLAYQRHAASGIP